VNLAKDDEKEKIYFERFYIPVKLEVEDPNPNEAAGIPTHQFWEIDINQVDTLRTLGGGASASVFLSTLWGVQVAMKKWEFGRLDQPPVDFTRELETLM
jgi:hypothetical protein